MTITARNSDSTIVFGNFDYGTGFVTPGLTFLGTPLNAFREDLDTLVPPPGEVEFWQIAWRMFLYTPNVLGRVSKLYSALPKFTLGSADITYRGSLSDSFFVQYTSQISKVYTCWLTTEDPPLYPSPYIAPIPEDDANMYTFDMFSTLSTVAGDSFALNFNGGDAETASLIVYYQANYFEATLPTSLGDN